MKLKICGQKHNIEEVAALQPDYLGFIFWEPSVRHFNTEMPELASGIKKVGVFVDAEIEVVLENVIKYRLDAVQLHGSESAEYCKKLKEKYPSFRDVTLSAVEMASRKKKTLNSGEFSTALDLTVVKAFSLEDRFNFSVLEEYESVCDYFLFDTKGKLPGGTGLTFDWSILKDYPSTKPYFLSGGIGLEELDTLKEFLKRPESKYCHAIDVNSRFEVKPGLKDIEKLKKFKEKLLITDY